MKKTLLLTPEIQEANETLIAIRDALPTVLRQSMWQHRVQVAEKLEFIKELATAKRILWQQIESCYPELKGLPYTVSRIAVIYDAPDTPHSNTL